MVVLISYLLSVLACAALHAPVGTASARRIGRKQIHALQQQAADIFNKNGLAVLTGGGDAQLSAGVKNFTFSNPAASGE